MSMAKKYFQYFLIVMLLLHKMNVFTFAEESNFLLDMKIQNSCKITAFIKLPKGLKRLMAKEKCDVKNGSNYNYGYSVDINDDGRSEFFFCCSEVLHGPCPMVIFGIVNGYWKNLTPNVSFSGYDDGETPCLGFSILKSKNEGYRDIFQDGNLLRFQNGEYKELLKDLPTPQIETKISESSPAQAGNARRK